jgi:phosphopentomutase
MEKMLAGLATLPPGGLLVANLIDFDMLYGHRQDAAGFGQAMEEFDAWLPELQEQMRSEDLLLVTADHGCDPTTAGTDHTREYVPLLAWQPEMVIGQALGTRSSFADLAETLAEFFGLATSGFGRSAWGEIKRREMAGLS